MKKALTLAALAAGGLVLLTGFRGGCGGGHHGRDPARVAAFVTDRLDDALDDLDATDPQRAEIHALKDRLLARGAELAEGNAEARGELLAQWRSETPDRARLHALVDARIEAMRALAHEAVDAGVDAHAVLTPEQRAEVTRKIERRMERRAERRGER